MMPVRTNLPWDAYVRVSRVGERDTEGNSWQTVEQQRLAIQRWATQNNATVIGCRAVEGEDERERTETDVSGGTAPADRPVLGRLLERIRSGESAGIVSYRLDRLSRDMVQGLTVLKTIAESGGRFASATETDQEFMSVEPDDVLRLHISLMMASYYRGLTAKRWRESVSFAVNKGKYVSRGVPFGYDKVDGVLSPNADEPLAKDIFERKARGDSQASIATWLNKVRPLDDGQWTGSSVARLIGLHAYKGWSVVDGEHVKLENKDAHPPIVSEGLWLAAQGGNRSWTYLSGDDVSLLGGLVRCSGCRFVMSGSSNRSEERVRHYYRCRGKHRSSGECLSPASVRGDGEFGLDEYVERIVVEYLSQRASTVETTQSTDDLAMAVEARQTAQAYVEAGEAQQDAMHPADWAGMMARLYAQVRTADERVKGLEAAQHSRTTITPERYLALNREDRSKVIGQLVEAVMVKKVGPQGPVAKPLTTDRVLILWRGDDSRPAEDWPRAGRKAETGTGISPWHWPNA